MSCSRVRPMHAPSVEHSRIHRINENCAVSMVCECAQKNVGVVCAHRIRCEHRRQREHVCVSSARHQKKTEAKVRTEMGAAAPQATRAQSRVCVCVREIPVCFQYQGNADPL